MKGEAQEMASAARTDLMDVLDTTIRSSIPSNHIRLRRRAGTPAPRAIGVDEIAIRKGHNYRVVVSDLDRGRPIWVGGQGRTEADTASSPRWAPRRRRASSSRDGHAEALPQLAQ
jgi:transposase